MPSVNAIIPICNWVNRIEDCLKSLSTQTYDGEFTITVVDCGSRDGTIEMVKKYGCNILTKYNSPIEGIIGLTNFGIQNSKAELIWKVDADNIVTDNKVLIKLVEPFLQDTRINLSVPRQITNKNYNSFTNYLTLREMVPYYSMVSQSFTKNGWNLVEDAWYGIYNSTLMKKSAIDRVGGWDQDIRVLNRLRKLGLSSAALVQNACYYHDQRVDPITYMKKMKQRIRFFGSMDSETKMKYFVKPIESTNLEESTIENLKKEIRRAFVTGGIGSPKNIANELIYQVITLLSLFSSPISSLRIIKEGIYR